MWFKVDDSLPTHHRVLEAGNAAMGLWVRCGAWSMGQLTDGFIPIQAALMFGSQTEIDALVRTGLWIEEDGGYQFHRWAEDGSGAPRQPTRAEVEANRKRDRERKRAAMDAARAKGSRKDSDAQPPEGQQDSARIPVGIQTDSTDRSGNPDPTRPDPTPTTSPTSDEVGEARGKRAPRRTATRIPEDFAPTPEMLEWAAQNAAGVDVARATDMFRNHWTAKSGKDATKLDWQATWKNWIHREADYSKPRTGITGGRESSLDRRDRQREQMFADIADLEARTSSSPFGAIGA